MSKRGGKNKRAGQPAVLSLPQLSVGPVAGGGLPALVVAAAAVQRWCLMARLKAEVLVRPPYIIGQLVRWCCQAVMIFNTTKREVYGY